jgi:hypothetical protein
MLKELYIARVNERVNIIDPFYDYSSAPTVIRALD